MKRRMEERNERGRNWRRETKAGLHGLGCVTRQMMTWPHSISVKRNAEHHEKGAVLLSLPISAGHNRWAGCMGFVLLIFFSLC